MWPKVHFFNHLFWVHKKKHFYNWHKNTNFIIPIMFYFKTTYFSLPNIFFGLFRNLISGQMAWKVKNPKNNYSVVSTNKRSQAEVCKVYCSLQYLKCTNDKVHFTLTSLCPTNVCRCLSPLPLHWPAWT